ncbi:hypothetical protein [Alteromonas lipolytica]|uniref:Uncharacterized protein n=1 Tax=Alteromonas lipolytica TaxID=1856405 RepID=A0A1E8FG66_9ALTE|nr:hypothetical protein [Alteromonas lipolytica]OFI34921.1 hypothetical protein BFC17_15255 [Alteromonas lipolytica]GGF55117.1 hypothetical protein GCM10011338_04190 [Alteromonas lipolytica]
MANNSRNDDFPTIRLDEEDRRGYQSKATQVHRSVSPSQATTSAETTKSGGGAGWGVTALLVAIIGCGAAGYLYTLTQQQSATLQSAEQRIQQLENKLSATGEEIGESTVALQVKVTELSNRTTELWEQMDKLWASAWRRNQKEIADLSDKVAGDKKDLLESVSQVARNLDGQKTQLATLNSSLETVSDEMLAINVQMEQISAGNGERQQQVKNLDDKIALLEQRNNALSSRIASLEAEIRDLATKMVSSSSSSQASASPAGPAGGQ